MQQSRRFGRLLSTSDAALSWVERITKWIVWGVSGGVFSTISGVIIGFISGNPLSGLVIGVVVGMLVLVAFALQAVRIAAKTGSEEKLTDIDFSADEEAQSIGLHLQDSLQQNSSEASGSQAWPFANDQDLSASYVSNRSLYIFDLTRHSWIIKNRTFENCFVRGPAVVAVMGGSDFIDCHFTEAGDLSSLTWPVTEGRADHVGAIGLENCIFRSCTFLRIGLLVNLTDAEGNPLHP